MIVVFMVFSRFFDKELFHIQWGSNWIDFLASSGIGRPRMNALCMAQTKPFADTGGGANPVTARLASRGWIHPLWSLSHLATDQEPAIRRPCPLGRLVVEASVAIPFLSAFAGIASDTGIPEGKDQPGSVSRGWLGFGPTKQALIAREVEQEGKPALRGPGRQPPGLARRTKRLAPGWSWRSPSCNSPHQLAR